MWEFVGFLYCTIAEIILQRIKVIEKIFYIG